MARLLLRMLRLGLRWLAAPAVLRWVVRRTARSSVAKATSELETAVSERLPKPVADVVLALPSEVRAAGGSAVVATRAARAAGGTALTARRAARTVAATPTRARWAVRRRAGRPAALRDDIRAEADESGRRLRSRYRASTLGPDAATEALLDVRPEAGEPHRSALAPDAVVDGGVGRGDGRDGVDLFDAHRAVPPPVPAGRRRPIRPRRPRLPNRASRTYRRPDHPWE
jgi:hypothetical protein